MNAQYTHQFYQKIKWHNVGAKLLNVTVCSERIADLSKACLDSRCVEEVCLTGVARDLREKTRN